MPTERLNTLAVRTGRNSSATARLCLVLLLAVTTGVAAAEAADGDERMLFDFSEPGKADSWTVVNDTVMGGRSEGKVQLTESKTMVFSGRLSLENNGGFASVRTPAPQLALRQSDALVLKVRGDGRRYALNLYVPGRGVAFSYRAEFQTPAETWALVEIPLSQLVATSFGRELENTPLDAASVNGLGILLGDKQAGPFELEVAWIKVRQQARPLPPPVVKCQGVFPQHLQGVCVDDQAVYWSFTTQLIKTDWTGKPLSQVPVANHHGDLCLSAGKLYVAVNLGEFNNPDGHADSWVYVYHAEDLSFVEKFPTQDVVYGAGGIAVQEERFYVVGGLPDGVPENYIYEYDSQFQLQKKHVLASGHTLLGIQTAAFADNRWWFGCYGKPPTLLVSDRAFELQGRYSFDTSLGIDGWSPKRLLTASGRCQAGVGCSGQIRLAAPDETLGLILVYTGVEKADEE